MPRLARFQALDRALDLLEHLADRPGATLADLTHATDLPRSTVHRFLTYLRSHGYVVDHDHHWTIAARTAALARGFAPQATASHPHLRALAERTGLAASLVACEGDEAVYLHRAIPRSFTLVPTIRIGSRAPLYCTAVGKTFLARRSPADQAAYAKATRLQALTPMTITDPAHLLREIDAVAHQGWACDDEECERGVRCLAVAIPGEAGSTALAVSLSGPAIHVAAKPTRSQLNALREAAQAIAG